MSRVDAQLQALVARGQVALEAAQQRQSQRSEAVGQGFESLLLRELVSAMRSTVPESSLFPAHTGQDIYDHMMEQALSDHLAAGGGLGLAGLLNRELGVDAQPTAPSMAPPLGPAADADPLDPTHRPEIPLAERLPPQTDPWLTRSDAAHHLMALVEEGITDDPDDLPTGATR